MIEAQATNAGEATTRPALVDSDDPHWDSDDPDFARPTILSDDVLQAIQYDNAKRLYDL